MTEIPNQSLRPFDKKTCGECKHHQTPEQSCKYYKINRKEPDKTSDHGKRWGCFSDKKEKKVDWEKHGYYQAKSSETEKENEQIKKVTKIPETQVIKIKPLLGQNVEFKRKPIGEYSNPFATNPGGKINSVGKYSNPFTKEKEERKKSFEQRIKDALLIDDLSERTKVLQQIAKDKMKNKYL